ncbi:MAG: DUF2062 domain-containing protein [Leptospira sp.]|nr:DUF2062 domain-containing protein [Leptospira sp.]
MEQTNSKKRSWREEISWQGIKRNVYYKLIYPFKASNAPIHDVSLGAAIGMFWALSPTFGIQIPLLTLNWIVFRFFKIHFYMPVAFALLWITNVVTVPFFYYLFYIIGRAVCLQGSCMETAADIQTFQNLIAVPEGAGWLEGIIDVTTKLYVSFGYPLFIGGLVFGSLLSIPTYPLVRYFVTIHRKKIADEKGITLEEWERRALKH